MVKYALLIGINYLLTPSLRLNGSYNDVLMVLDYITNYGGFKKDNVLILTDILDLKKKQDGDTTDDLINELNEIEKTDGAIDDNVESKINKQEYDEIIKELYGEVNKDDTVLDASFFSIVKSLKQFNKILTENDSLFVYFSGHGGNIKDENGDELDKKDEIILPSDFSKHTVTDDLIKNIFKTVKGSLFFMIDACNSGSICDLKYKYDIKEKVFIENIVDTEDQEKLHNTNILSLSSCEDNKEAYEMKYEISPDIFKIHSSFTYKLFKYLNSNYKKNVLPNYKTLLENIVRLNDLKNGILHVSKKDLTNIPIFGIFNEKIKKQMQDDINLINSNNIVLLRRKCEKLIHDNKKLQRKYDLLNQRLEAYSTLYGSNSSMMYNFNNLLHSRRLR